MALITPTTSYDGFDSVDIVVEAVFENMDLKKTTFAELGTVTRPDCVLASNTSTLDIDEFARASGRPAQVIGHHFFSPANVMKLLEIVRGRETEHGRDRHVAEARRSGSARSASSSATASGSSPTGCSRTTCARRTCCSRKARASPQIDEALTDFGMPVGPFGMQDIAGIDVGARIRQYLTSIGKTRAEGPQSEMPDRLFEMGRYGQKTGAGWYKYEAGQPQPHSRSADRAARRGSGREARHHAARRSPTTRSSRASRRRSPTKARACSRKATRLRAGDIDVIYCYGFGFPRHRGGPMFYADTVGLPTVLARVQEYRARFGDYWQPAPLLERLVAEGRGFYDAACRSARRA